MAVNLRGRSFTKILDFTKEEIEYLLRLSAELKADKEAGRKHEHCKGKNVVLLFEKDSTRTRCAFEVGAADLGMHPTYLGPSGSQFGKKESIADTARVLGRMYDGIEYRGYAQETVEELAKYAGVPVWNGLTDMFHPTQMLADMLTIKEHKGTLKGLNFTYFGDARNNMGNSLMITCAKLGLNFTACAPKALWPEQWLIDTAKEIAQGEGCTVTLTEDPIAGARGADVLYTDVWVSMGEAKEVWGQRIELLAPYQVNKEKMDVANEGAIFLHCLPAFHDQGTTTGREVFDAYGMPELEVTNEVFESKQSKVFDEAENRLHTIKAIMAATIGV